MTENRIMQVLRDKNCVWNNFEDYDGIKSVRGAMVDNDVPWYLIEPFECWQTLVDGCFVLQVEYTPMGLFLCDTWHVHDKNGTYKTIMLQVK